MSQPPSTSSTPAPGATSTTATQAQSNGSSNAGPTAQQKHSANEIGWQFINQYYNFLHGSPDKLHRFYTKRSTYSHGVEGDDTAPSFGQQDIHAKIMSLGFNQVKAFVHSIHAQSSQAGGIIIQVVGEMQNGNTNNASTPSEDEEPWRKFTQTFFLAEQPNGYFVLNDIFRYLKEEGDYEEDVEVDEDVGVGAAAGIGAGASAQGQPIAVEQPSIIDEQEEGAVDVNETHTGEEVEQAADETSASPAAAAAHSEADNAQDPAPAAAAAVDAAVDEESTPAPAAAAQEETETAPEPTAAESAPAEATPEPATTSAAPPADEPTPVEEVKEEKKESVPAPAPVQSQPPAQQQQQQQQRQPPSKPTPPPQAPAQPPKPTGPPPPKTWASVSAGKANAWGGLLAQKDGGAGAGPGVPAGGSSTAPGGVIQPVRQQRSQRQPSQQGQAGGVGVGAGAGAAGGQGQGQAQGQGEGRGDQLMPQHPAGRFEKLDEARSAQTNICFVKLNNWQQTDTTPPVSEDVFRSTLSKYGEIVKIDFVKIKAIAFVEYKTIEGARRAVIASLRTQDGGEGGIRIPTDTGLQKIIVEFRKEKEERPRGGPAVGGGQPLNPRQGEQRGQRQGGQQGQGQGQGLGQGQTQGGQGQGPAQGQGQGQGAQNRGPRTGGRGGKGGQQGPGPAQK